MRSSRLVGYQVGSWLPWRVTHGLEIREVCSGTAIGKEKKQQLTGGSVEALRVTVGVRARGWGGCGWLPLSATESKITIKTSQKNTVWCFVLLLFNCNWNQEHTKGKVRACGWANGEGGKDTALRLIRKDKNHEFSGRKKRNEDKSMNDGWRRHHSTQMFRTHLHVLSSQVS